MDERSIAEIERACARLVVQYTHLVDFGEAEKVADLFTEEGVWESPQVRMNGKAEIRAGFRARQENLSRTSRHVCTNLSIRVLDENTAEGLVYLCLFRHDGEPGKTPVPLEGPVMVGQYWDRFCRTDQGWRFSHRKIGVTFVRPTKKEGGV